MIPLSPAAPGVTQHGPNELALQGVLRLLANQMSTPLANPYGASTKPNSDVFRPLFQPQGQQDIPGLLAPGNIDPYTRPVHQNSDGSISTVRSISVTDNDGHAILLPTITPDGRLVSPEQAIELWRRTGQHLGIFKNERLANEYAVNLHDQQAQQYLPKGS